MIDWGAGYVASWRLMEVDPETWADTTEVPDVASIAVERGDEQLVESGTAEVTLDVGTDFGERWCRVEMLAEQNGEHERVAIATMLFAPSSISTSHLRDVATIEGRSVLAPAADEAMLAGSYVPKGADGAAEAARLIRSCTPAPVVVEGTFRLVQEMVFAQGTTKVEAAWMLLDAANWCIQIDGDGTIHIRPKPTEPTLELDHANASLIATEVTTESSLWTVPNRYIAIDNGEMAIATNSAPADPTSYQSRGRWVDEVDTSPTRIDGESLQGYAERMLAERHASLCSKTYTREWWPDVTVSSLVRGGLSSVGLVGDMRVTSQSLTCGAGVSITETAEVIS